MEKSNFNLLLLWIFVYNKLTTGLFITNDRLSQFRPTTIEAIEGHGYPVETHEVKTIDGYILIMHRIPYSPKNQSKKIFPIFLQHGLGASSNCWVLNKPKYSIPFILADLGYDVWMGNSRGNSYSSNHTYIFPNSKEYWNYSWHEIGIYDLPAMIDYILNYTKANKLHYIGHSQGTTAFFVCLSELPHYNQKILSMHALSPVVFQTHFGNPVARILSNVLGYPSKLAENFGSRPFSKLIHFSLNFAAELCRTISDIFCLPSLYLLFGFNGDNIDKEIVPVLTENFPEGSSVKCAIHYLQLIKSHKFRKYDYGLGNLMKYGSLQPPDYSLFKVKSPIFLYSSRNDLLSSVEDVKTLSLALPKSSVYMDYTVPDKYHYNHVDYLFAKNVKTLIYDKLIKNLTNIETINMYN